jgi:hypothetical protein
LINFSVDASPPPPSPSPPKPNRFANDLPPLGNIQVELRVFLGQILRARIFRKERLAERGLVRLPAVEPIHANVVGPAADALAFQGRVVAAAGDIREALRPVGLGIEEDQPLRDRLAVIADGARYPLELLGLRPAPRDGRQSQNYCRSGQTQPRDNHHRVRSFNREAKIREA